MQKFVQDFDIFNISRIFTMLSYFVSGACTLVHLYSGEGPKLGYIVT